MRAVRGLRYPAFQAARPPKRRSAARASSSVTLAASRWSLAGVLLQRLALTANHLRDGSGQLTSRSNLEQLGDEGSLSPDVASTKIPNLPLPDHRHRLKARQRSSRGPEAAEAKPWADQTSYAPVVLFHNVIEELALP
jgi:hypothetical protein